jgi:indolepyruvate ferredoxin oxidoreductase beta subunit
MRPVTLLIAALGGEGGGVLTGWIVEAARAARLPVQATSIPGVAQRTGATTYYIEIWPEAHGARVRPRPVLALSPAADEVDIMLASELLEAARAIQAGLVTPDRTTLIASTHRVHTTREKMAMGDGRFDSAQLIAAARDRAADCRLADLAAVAKGAGAPLGSVMLGALCASGKLPIDASRFRDAIKAGGKAVEANLRGFEAGLAMEEPAASRVIRGQYTYFHAGEEISILSPKYTSAFPADLHETLGQAVARLTDYQDAAYAELYLDRLKPFAGGDASLLRAVARHLAVRMTYEDIFRVAQAKTRPARIARILVEAGAGQGDTVTVTEFFKPGFAEIRDVLPVRLAGWLNGRPGLQGWARPMELRTTTVWGYLRLRALAALRRTRRATWRHAAEQAQIESWLDMIARAAALSLEAGADSPGWRIAEGDSTQPGSGPGIALAREIADCARLIKGYGDTHRRGVQNFDQIEQALIAPALAGRTDPATAATHIAQAREAALADPEGGALTERLAAE